MTALLLVGGLSRRMGADKASLVLAGHPLWERQIKVLRDLQPASVWISARTRPEWCPHDAGVIFDEPPSRGPLSGVAAALRRLKTTHLLVLAIDMPQMTAEFLRKLWSLTEPACGLIPRGREIFEPLCAIYPAEAAGIAELSLAGEDVSLQAFASILVRDKRAKVYPLAREDNPLFHNVNTPADLLSSE